MTTDDLKNYTVRWVKPVSTTFQGNYTLFSVPPPGSGPVLAYILGIMDKFRSENESCLPDNITTLHSFGSLVRTKSGVLLNNQMDDFSRPGKPNVYGLAPSKANFIVPGKRPMSSMAPMVIVDDSGEVQLAMGGTGGSLITSGIALDTVTLHKHWDERTRVIVEAAQMAREQVTCISKPSVSLSEKELRFLEGFGARK
ncbi:hypothetical protein HPB51_014372 [Rhipicephalus microplus]|uniref:Gamma-glutamyltransferase n=1 Tax=Rhipicephalus microplus TaxID=6941 RepID=A0A9J6F543_RHIMP|nr:hypothetical protein HPB51_014372 [Rhipicephalus microplus]